MRSSEMFLELWLLRYRAKGRNEQNVVGDEADTYKTYYLTISSANLFGLMLYFFLLEIQMVIIISTPATISALAFISPILSPAKPILPVSLLNIFFPAILINLIILSYRFIYYRDRYPRLLY
jgi:hypothetical protein